LNKDGPSHQVSKYAYETKGEKVLTFGYFNHGIKAAANWYAAVQSLRQTHNMVKLTMKLGQGK
jgi:hypothetical protein